MAEPVDPNIPSGLSKLLSQGDTSLTAGQTERAAMMYCRAYAWDPCVTETHLNTLSHESFQAFVSVLEDYCVWGFDTGRYFPMQDINLTLEQLCDWITKSNMKPNSLVAWATKVNIQMHKCKYNDVIDSCSHVIKIASNKDLSFLLMRGTAHLRLHHTEEAVNDFVAAFEFNLRVTNDYIQETQTKNLSDLIKVFCEFIESLKEKADSRKTWDDDTRLLLVKCYQFLVMVQPAEVRTYLECADVFMQLSKHKDAVILLSEAMEFAKDDTDVLCIALQRAEVYLITGELELALYDYLTASRINAQFTCSALKLLPLQNQAKIVEQAKHFGDRVLAYYRSQAKSRRSCFINSRAANKQLSHACDCYDLLFVMDSTNSDMLLNSAECLLLQRKELKALEVYSKAVALNTNCAKAYCARGSCFVSLDDMVSALSDYDHAVSIQPSDARAICGKINALVLLGQLEESVSVLSKAVKDNSLEMMVDGVKELRFEQKETLRVRLATFLKTTVQNAKVVNRNEELCLLGQVLTRVFPNDLASHLAYSLLLLSRDQEDESQSILVRFVNNNPSSYQAPVRLALLKMRIGKTSVAIKELCSVMKNIGEDKLTEVFKDVDPKSRALVSREAFSQGMRKTVAVTEKIALFTIAIAANPTPSWSCHFQRGKHHLASNQLDLALRDFSSAINFNPKHIPSYAMRALVLLRQQFLEESIEDLLVAMQIDSKVLVQVIQTLPGHARQLLLGVLFDCVQKQFSLFNANGVKSELMLPLSLLLVQSDSSVALYHNTLADAYVVFENYQEAVKELEITEQLSASIDTFVIGQLGLAHVKMGNYAAAVNSFCRMSQLDQNGLKFILETLNINQRQTLAQQAVNRANDLLTSSNYEDALAFLNVGVAASKGQRSDVLRMRCVCYTGLQSYSRALDDIMKVITLGNTLIGDYCTRASLRSQLGEFPGACADVMNAMDMDEKVALETLKNKHPDVELVGLFVNGAFGLCNCKMYREALKMCSYGRRVDQGNDELRKMQEKLSSGSNLKHSCVVQ